MIDGVPPIDVFHTILRYVNYFILFYFFFPYSTPRKSNE